MRKKMEMRSITDLLNIWVIGISVSLACIALFFALTLLWVTRTSSSSNIPVTAIINITSASTTTISTLSPTLSNNNASSTPPPPSPPSDNFTLGAYVQVTGTSGEGLRLRDQPGLGSKILLLSSEAEVFRIDDGPQEIDGYTWWYLVGPFDENRKGWAVSNYLTVIQNP